MNISLKDLARNSGVVFSGHAVGALIGFLQGVLVTRALGPAQLGKWGIVFSFCWLVFGFIGFRTFEPLSRYLVEYKETNDRKSLSLLIATALTTDFVCYSAAWLIICCSSHFIWRVIGGDKGMYSLYIVYGTSMYFNFVNNSWYALTRDAGKFKSLVGIPNLFSLLQLIVIASIIFFFNSFDLVKYASVYLFISFLLNTVRGYQVIQYCRTMYGLPFEQLRFGSIIKDRHTLYGFWKFMQVGYFSSCVTTIVKNVDVLILGHFRPESDVGIYRLARSLASYFMTVTNSLTAVLFRDCSELVTKKQWVPLKKALLRISRVISPFAVACSVLGMCFSGKAISLIYGIEFSEATGPVNILIGGIMVAIIFFWAHPMILALQKMKEFLVLNICNSLTMCIIMFASTPLIGALGIAAALSFSWIVSYVGMMVIVLKEIDRSIEKTKN